MSAVVIVAPPTEQRPANAVAQAVTGRDYVSWSQLSTARQCPKRFHYQYVERARPEFVSASLGFGGSVHAMLEAYYQARLEGLTLGQAELHEAYRRAWADQGGREPDVPVQFNKNESEQSLDELAGRMAASFLESELAELPGDIIALEEPFRGTLDDELPDVVARIDLAWRDDTALRLVDFKTARARWSDTKAVEGGDQLLLYGRLACGLAEDAGLSVLTQFAVITKAKKPVVQVIDVPGDDARVASLVESMKAIWSSVVAGHAYPNVGYWCSTCPFRGRCPAWAGRS